MTAIDIDFQLYKRLTIMRETEEETFTHVINRLLDEQTDGERIALDEGVVPDEGVIFLQVHFPSGSKFRSVYKGKTYTGEIIGSSWIDENGARHSSPSAAAKAITGNNVNGWEFWNAQRPGEPAYRRMNLIWSAENNKKV